jgi:hypothetical protein
MEILNIPQNSPLIRLVVPNRSFGTLFLSASLVDSTPSTGEVVSTLTELFHDVKVQRAEPKSFESVKELVGIEYVGYIIDKERLNRTTGQWSRIDEYRIIGVDSESFIDSRVAYGEVYRYRIKNVVRITKKEKSRERLDNENFQSLGDILKKRVKEEIQKKIELFTNTNVFTNRGIASKHSSEIIQVPLFDDFIATFDGSKIEILQQGKQSTNDLRLSKNSLITNVDVLGQNINVYLPFINQNVFVEKIAYKSYYYESLPSKQWKYTEIYETEPPPPPECIKINPNTLSKKIIITWLRPSNSQRDIKSYRLYRREGFGAPWSLLKEVNELDINSDGVPDVKLTGENSASVYVDTNVTTTQKYIYALTCVDIHDIESFLSAQIQAQLNPAFNTEKEEKPLKWVSGSGAKLSETNFVYKRFLNRTEQIVAKKNIKITPSVNFSDTEKTFLIRITSLDTHMKNEYRIKLVNQKEDALGAFRNSKTI